MEEKAKQDEVEIDIKEIMILILQHAAVIIMAAICVGIFLYTKGKCKISTVYTSTTKMYILSRNNQDDTVKGDSSFTESILDDYKALITSKEIIEEVNRKLVLERSYEALVSQISVNIPEDGKIAQISVTDMNPIDSMRIANTLRDVMAQYLKTTMDIKLFDIIEEAMVGVPSTVDQAKRNAVLGAFMVACMIMGIIVVRYLADDTIKTPEEIEAKLGLSVLATIPVSESQVEPKKLRFMGRTIRMPKLNTIRKKKSKGAEEKVNVDEKD